VPNEFFVLPELISELRARGGASDSEGETFWKIWV